MDAGEGWTSHRDDQRHRLPDRPRGLAAGRRGVGLGQPRSVSALACSRELASKTRSVRGSPRLRSRFRFRFRAAAGTNGARHEGPVGAKRIDTRVQAGGSSRLCVQAGGASRLRVRAGEPARLHASVEDGDVMPARA